MLINVRPLLQFSAVLSILLLASENPYILVGILVYNLLLIEFVDKLIDLKQDTEYWLDSPSHSDESTA